MIGSNHVTGGALSGLVVADFSRVLAGPYATMMLADLGATVIKVERPGVGDDTRTWSPPTAPDGQSTYFHSVNRNKFSIDLDLADDGDVGIARRLAAKADIVVENYKPGSLEKFDLDYPAVALMNPAVIYCSISGFGRTVGRDLPGYDLLVQAMGGLMSVTGSSEPTKSGVAVVDVLTGLHAAVGILAALHHRTQTGEGQNVEVTLLGAMQSSLVNQASAYVSGGVIPGLMGNAHPSIAPYDVYSAADRLLVIAVGNDAQFRRLCSVLGRDELAEDARFETNTARVAHRSELREDLESVLTSYTADYWQEQLTVVGIPCGPINNIAQGIDLAERLGLKPVVRVDDGPQTKSTRQVANPLGMSRTPAAYYATPPQVGRDREAVLEFLAGPRG